MAEGKKTIFAVENMSCDHCATRVTKAIKRLAPQSEVDVDLPTGDRHGDARRRRSRRRGQGHCRGRLSGAGDRTHFVTFEYLSIVSWINATPQRRRKHF